MKTIDDNAIIRRLIECNGNKTAAADRLHIARKTIYNRLADNDFKRAYEAAKLDTLEALKTDLTGLALLAAAELRRVLLYDEALTRDKLAAARIVFDGLKVFTAQEIKANITGAPTAADIEAITALLAEYDNESDNSISINKAEYDRLKTIEAEKRRNEFYNRLPDINRQSEADSGETVTTYIYE